SRERFRDAALSGEIEQLLAWREIRAGDVFVIYPGTIHALGPGVVVAEIQQNSDLTYRIYDYGRPRPLHLDRAEEVAVLGPYAGCPAPVDLGSGWKRLARTPYFAAEILETSQPVLYEPDSQRFHLLLVLEGSAALDGQPVRAGECWFVPAAAAPFQLRPRERLCLLRSYYPGQS
ncbi:MAG: class I mannose-6-phosphate isomerase, partial [Bryobacteraceae bacterium]